MHSRYFETTFCDDDVDVVDEVVESSFNANTQSRTTVESMSPNNDEIIATNASRRNRVSAHKYIATATHTLLPLFSFEVVESRAICRHADTSALRTCGLESTQALFSNGLVN